MSKKEFIPKCGYYIIGGFLSLLILTFSFISLKSSAKYYTANKISAPIYPNEELSSIRENYDNQYLIYEKHNRLNSVTSGQYFPETPHNSLTITGTITYIGEYGFFKSLIRNDNLYYLNMNCPSRLGNLKVEVSVMNKDDILKLSVGDKVTFVGDIDDISKANLIDNDSITIKNGKLSN